MFNKLLQWLASTTTAKAGQTCRHRMVKGLGMYGDAYTCIDCGLSLYHDDQPWTYKAMAAAEILPETPANIARANDAIRRKAGG